MAEYKNIRIAVSGIYEYAFEELPSLRLSIQDAPDWVERKKIYKVYRPAIVLAKAVDMFKLLPLTHEHPIYPVDSQNFRDLIVGYTGENPSVEYIADTDEVGIRSTALLYDDEAITAYENGEIQLSPGYLADFEWNKGIAPNGQEYDIVMKEIKGVNHLALLKNGRGGKFAIVLDGASDFDISDIDIFEFIAIRNELAEFLENSESEDVSVEDAGKPEGTISHRKDGDYRKQGGKWRKIYSGESRGASISAGRVASKIRKAQTVDELVDLVMNNTSRFTDANGKLLPVVERIKNAVDKRKKELAAEKKSKEAESAQKPAEEKSEAKSAETEKTTGNETPELKEPKKPDIINGYFNGKIYGNEKYGYRIYIDNKEKKISAKQKSEIENYQKEKSQYEKDVRERKENAPVSESVAKETFFAKLAGVFVNSLWSDKKHWERIKKNIKVHKDDEDFLTKLGVQKALDNIKTQKKPFSPQLKYKNTSTFENVVEKLKTDKEYRNQFVKEFVDYTDSKIAKKEKEQKEMERADLVLNRGFSSLDLKVNDYIEQHGKPSIVEGHFWNGKVYGGEKNPHVYLDGKKKYLSESDKKEFGL